MESFVILILAIALAVWALPRERETKIAKEMDLEYDANDNVDNVP